MPAIDVVVSSPVSRSMRARQVEAIFDVPPQEKQTLRWSGDVPLDERPWNVGLIVGPSGCGKSTVARELFGERATTEFEWSGASVLDDFPADAKLEDLSAICQAVGFNTIPAWLRPYSVLSNGEKFRVTLARTLYEMGDLAVVDEFTSVVDRQVAQIGSHAVQKHVRKRGSRFVAVSCHSDIIGWLDPDWILEPATMTFTWRALQRRRPSIDIEIARVDHAAWRTFAPYHYMSADLHPAAACYCAFVGGVAAAFSSLLFRPAPSGAQNIWGCPRGVTLPDYQGLGLMTTLQDTLGASLKACGRRMRIYPAHPALIRSYNRNTNWRLVSKPGIRVSTAGGARNKDGTFRFGGRPNATFEYTGPAHPDRNEAREFLGIRSIA